jgi:hypothetical protein
MPPIKTNSVGAFEAVGGVLIEILPEPPRLNENGAVRQLSGGEVGERKDHQQQRPKRRRSKPIL